MITRTLLSVAAAAALVAACGDTATTEADRTEGPVVSTSETPRNEAVDTTPTTERAPRRPAPARSQRARRAARLNWPGYTDVGALTQDAQGIWQGKATMGGVEKAVSVDYKGTVTAQ